MKVEAAVGVISAILAAVVAAWLDLPAEDWLALSLVIFCSAYIPINLILAKIDV